MPRNSRPAHRRSGVSCAWVGIALAALLPGAAVAALKAEAGRGSINSGLGPPPPLVLRASPASTWRSFFALGEKGEFALAAHLLDLGEVPPGDQQKVGAEVAEKLYHVLRVVRAKPGDVVDETRESVRGDTTDALLALRFQRQGIAGEVWLRRIVDHATGEGAWLVNQQAVSSTPLWYRLLVQRRTLEAAKDLNTGLGSPPASLLRSSPREVLTGFLATAREGRFADAAHYLDLGALPPARQRTAGALLARRLMFVLERRPWIDPDTVSDDPAGTPQAGMDDDRQRLGAIPLGERDVDIVLQRFVDAERRFVWVFSRDTVREVDALYAAHGYGWLGDQLPRVFFATTIGGLQLWQWLALTLIVVVGFAVSRVIGHWIAVALRHIAARTRVTWDDCAVATIDGPLGIFLWAVVIATTARVVGLSPETVEVLQRLWKILLVVSFGWYCFKVLDAVSRRLKEQAQSGNAITLAVVPILQRVGKFIVALLAILAALDVVGVNVAAALAGVGLGGLALAFAAQKTLENVFGALSIAGDRPFRVGDFVRIGDVVGTVEDVGLRSTRVRTVDRTVVTIPNASVVADKIVNLAERDRILFDVTIGLVYNTTAAQLTYVIDSLRRLLLEDPRLAIDGQYVRFWGFGASSLDIRVFAFVETKDFATFTAVAEELNFRIMEVVEASGSSFAFPSQTLYLALDGGTASDRADAAAAEVEARRKRGELLAAIPSEAELAEARARRTGMHRG